MSSEAIYIKGSQLRANRVEGSSHLRLEIEEQVCILSARVKRIFPLSDPNRYFSIQTEDDKEVAILTSLDGADDQTHRLLIEEFDRRYFSPKITQILEVKSVPGMWSFHVNTNRGEITFYVRNWRENSHEIESGRWHITSVDGQRFEIEDLDALDRKSQTLVEQLL